MILEIENKIKALPDWPLFCKAKAADDSSCSDDSFNSPLFYLKKFIDGDWTEKS